MYTKTQYQRAFADFQHHSPKTWPKYASATAEELLFSVLGRDQRIPSVTTIQLTIDALAKTGLLFRADGKTEEDDRKERVRIAQQDLDRTIQQVASKPLTVSEQEYFASLSYSDLASKYWANNGYNEFRVRYDLAHRQAGFRLPARPAEAEVVSEDGAIELTAAEYHALPTDTLRQKLRSPRFALAVRQLMKRGEI